MARLFDDAQTEYLEIDSAVVTACPFTMACWFNSDNTSLAQGIMWIGDKDETNVWIALVARGNFGGDPIALQRFIAGSTVASTTTGYSANTWHHACGVLRANDDVSVFIDGGSEGTDNINKVPAGFDRTAIGGLRDDSPGTYFSGLVAEAAFWNIALTDAEVAILAKGFSPLFVRPQNLVAYWPLIRDEDQDRVGGYDLTAF